ncbi:MAG: membrane protein insertase YidC [Actinobacteria bacterium]|nr:membrane protein insertase YidC [Actinomycetota bacterium]
MNPLNWLETIVASILTFFHKVLSLVFDPDSGWAWALSIVCLVVLIRILLIPLFVKQIKSQRNMQLIQPQVKEIQRKYAGDRERTSQELMKLYKETGTNPLSSCLPILAQAPIFFALFQVLQGIAQSNSKGGMSTELLTSAHNATVFGAPLYATFTHRTDTANPSATAIVTVILIVLMTVTTFLTQRQLIVKNSAADNPMVQQQKILLYVFPFIFAISGINFPVGVLLYWLTTNIWTMCQQFYVIRNSPAPGTPAEAALEARKAAKAAKKASSSGAIESDLLDGELNTNTKTQRNQPSRKSRKKKN